MQPWATSCNCKIFIIFHMIYKAFQSLMIVLQERPRPTFAALAPTVARNPVTGIMEPHFPEERRTHRVFSGIAVVLTMVSLVLVFMLGVIVYKLLVYRPLAKNPSTKAKAQQIANMTGAMVNLMTIMILSRVRMVCFLLHFLEYVIYTCSPWCSHSVKTIQAYCIHLSSDYIAQSCFIMLLTSLLCLHYNLIMCTVLYINVRIFFLGV